MTLLNVAECHGAWGCQNWQWTTSGRTIWQRIFWIFPGWYTWRQSGGKHMGAHCVGVWIVWVRILPSYATGVTASEQSSSLWMGFKWARKQEIDTQVCIPKSTIWVSRFAGTGNNAMLGTYSWYPASQYLGCMDDVFVYTRALAATEIAEIYNSYNWFPLISYMIQNNKRMNLR